MKCVKLLHLVVGLLLNIITNGQQLKTRSRRGECIMIAPHEFHIDERETVIVTVSKSQHSNIAAELAFDDGARKFGHVEKVISSSEDSKQFHMVVSSRDIANKRGTNRIHLVGKCNGKEVVRNKIKISENKITVLIQTDKPIYTPKQTVLSRVYTLDRHLLPIDTPLRVDIINPQGIIVQRDTNPLDPEDIDDLSAKNKPGIFHSKFVFPSIPMFGEWQIVVHYGKNFVHREKSVFVVEEYELPNFSVDLNVDADVIFPVTHDLGLDITAKYVFGGFVKGSAFCKFGIINTNREIMFRSVSFTQFDGEGCHVVIDMQWVKDMYWFPKIDGSRLLIECNVTDSNSIKTVTAINRKSIFSRSPYAVNFEKSQGYFKPNLPFFLQASVSYINGEPTPANTPVNVVVLGTNGRELPATRKSLRTGQDGLISAVLDTKPYRGKRTIKITLPEFGDTSYTHTIVRDSTAGGKFISVTPLQTKVPIKEGQTLGLAVHASTPGDVDALHYVIISKGIIHHHEIMRFTQGKQINIHISREYVPVISVLVFYKSNTAGVVSDTISLDVEYDCESKKTFSVVNGGRQFLPGDEVTVHMTGPPLTYFTLMAVDHAVYFLRNRSRLTADKMLRVLTRNVVKQHKLHSTQDAVDQTSVAILGNTEHNRAGADQASLKNRGQPRRSKTRARRMRRDAESGDEEGEIPWSDEAYYQYDDDMYYYAYDEHIEYESGEEDDIMDDSHQITTAEPEVQMLSEAECCHKGETDYILHCKAAAMNLTELAVSETCVAAFYNCCLHQQVAKVRQQEDQNHPVHFDIRYTDSEEKDIFEVYTARKTGVVRRWFPESWMFDVQQIGHHSGSKEFTYRVPDSITKWDIQAVTLHHITGLCVLNTRELTVAKDIFLLVDMPYEAVRTEHLEVKVTIHNKYSKRITADVYIVGVPGVCTNTEPGKRSKKVTVSLYPGKQEHVSWAVMPVKVGKHHLRFELHARPYDDHNAEMKLVDAVIKPLHVSAEGVERIRTVASYLLDPNNVVSSSANVGGSIQRESVRLLTPPDAIPGSVEATIKINGDIMGPAVDTVTGDLNQLLRQPMASGEQTLLTLGPILSTAKYLKKTNQLSVKQRRRARKRIKRGVQKLLTFRKSDGSFAIWSNAVNSSSWMTSYVGKLFAESSEFGALTGEPVRLLCTAGNWLSRQQSSDGSFREMSPFSTHQIVNKNDVEGTVALTAFAIVALKSINCSHNSVITKAQDYLHQNLGALKFKPYPLSLAAYAFTLTHHRAHIDAAEMLWHDRIMRCQKQHCHWPADRRNLRQPTWYKQPKVLEVETASYALMAYMQQKNFRRANKIAKWLVEQRNDKGAFVSTQDTMLALEALAIFSSKTRRQGMDLELKLASSKNRDFQRTIRITEQNSLEQQHLPISRHIDGELHMTCRGRGVGQAHIHLKYNSKSDDNMSSCKFDLSVQAEEKHLGFEDLVGSFDRRRRSMRRRLYNRSRRRSHGSSSYIIEISTCVRYLDTTSTGLALLEVGLFTGFEPIETQLKELKKIGSNKIGRYEVHHRAVHFFLDVVPHNRQTCFTFDVRQKQKVGNIQPVAVTVYDLNEPSARCTKFYRPHSSSVLTQITCRSNGECTCRN